jgi:hypothetical protein
VAILEDLNRVTKVACIKKGRKEKRKLEKKKGFYHLAGKEGTKAKYKKFIEKQQRKQASIDT